TQVKEALMTTRTNPNVCLSIGAMLALTLITQLLLPEAAPAQTDQGRIVGTVRDQQNAVISAATVLVKNERTGQERTVTANEQGQYMVAALNPSFYKIRFSGKGFTASEFTNVQLSVGQELRLDVELKPAGATEVMSVVGAEEPAIDASSARL